MGIFIINVLIMFSLSSVFPVYASDATTLFEQGQLEYQQGHFEPAIRHWRAALALPRLATAERVEIMTQLASAYQTLGLSQQALIAISQTEPLAKQMQNKPISHRSALILTKLFLVKSDVSLATRQDVQARFYADKSWTLLPPNAPILIRASVLNNLGNVLTVEAYYAKAVKKYAYCSQLAQSAGDAILSGRALINMAYAYFKDNQYHAAVNALSAAQQQFESVNLSYAKAFGLISVGELAQRFFRHTNDSNHQLRMMAYQALNSALSIAIELNKPRLISYAYGFLGHVYETAQRHTEALYLTRQAIFYAKLDPRSFFTQQNQASEILYRWQWQLGRLFKAQRNLDEAINAYRNAANSLQPIRLEIATGYRSTSQSFRERVGPVYFELADLLLQRAAYFHEQKQLHKQQQTLTEALDTIERFKTAELQDYFQDECVTEAQSKRNLLDKQMAPSTAIIYPIMLPNRSEILLSRQGQLQQFSVPITASQLKEEVNEFRFELQASDTDYFLAYAKSLYQWLIAPLEQSLTAAGVDTLVIVPDGVLRTIPFAALHDGQQFLIDKYAIVTIPGLTLTETKLSHRRTQTKILVAGLSESVQGYSALESVRDEIQGISELYPSRNTTQLLDQDFTRHRFTAALKRTIYSILHIASHGQFDSEPQKTFLLTYDGKLSMNQLSALIKLSELRQEPMELLTLSACQTAIGDDQAALGLAGIALKAGAKTALASLWFIDDKATTRLMNNFYLQLQEQGLSKANALQMAQQDLLKDYRYRHPAYWAPFLLIGHWQ